CSHRATWRIQNRRGSSRRWMKVQWQVTLTEALQFVTGQVEDIVVRHFDCFFAPPTKARKRQEKCAATVQ
ncbi:hypothetical protein GFL85_27000, partial [Rhizobium laguerreae]|nr:hypothetical protein [Rhizobium laguerreae]